MFEFNAGKFIKFIEKALLAVIALLTIVATLQEILKIYEIGEVNLADLLLLFIYTEVLGMIGVFYTSNRIPITALIYCNDCYRSSDNFTGQRNGCVNLII